MNPVRILDCTLRDGSYVVDFQFTAEDTAVLAAGLESAGIELIEIGHGLGMNASNAGRGRAAATDEEYLAAAASALTRASWGMFFIPGIGRLEDLDLGARHGMRFVRIGTNATQVEEAEPYVRRAKSLGLMVSANLMKSYGLAPDRLARQAARAASYGCDCVALVDSAGTMLPAEVREYINVLLTAVDVPIGFHGHDNLSLGIANALTAIECGAAMVDSTLQGMGRGGGNASTEALVAVLKRQGGAAGINLNRLLDLSDRVVRPMLRNRGVDPLDVTAGYAGFHSSYLQTILRYAAQYRIDARDLIIAVCEIDRFSAPDELVDRVARRLSSESSQASVTRVPPQLIGTSVTRVETAAPLQEAVRTIASEARSLAVKTGCQSVINIVAASEPSASRVSPFIQEQFGFVIGTVELDNADAVRSVVSATDSVVDFLLVDAELKPYLERPLIEAAEPKNAQLLAYKDNDVWVRAVAQQMDAMWRHPTDQLVTICGAESSALKLALMLAERGVELIITGDVPDRLASAIDAVRRLAVNTVSLRAEPDVAVAAAAARCFVPLTSRRGLVDRSIIDAMHPASVVFVASVGAVTTDAIEIGLDRDILFVRPDMRAALAAELAAVAGARRLAGELGGRSTIAGVPIVAGGVVGRRGDVVVDSIARPTRVLGVADGRGAVLYRPTAEFGDRVTLVEAHVWRQRMALS